MFLHHNLTRKQRAFGLSLPHRVFDNYEAGILHVLGHTDNFGLHWPEMRLWWNIAKPSMEKRITTEKLCIGSQPLWQTQ